MNLPDNFTEAMKDLLGDEYGAFLESYDASCYFGIRANTLNINGEDLLSLLGMELEPVPWCKTGYYYPGDFRPGKSPLYHAGLYYIQEPSAIAPGDAIDIRPGHKVLDLCAAPGGKTTQLGAKLGGSGLIVSNDISPSRCKFLMKNVSLFGLKNSIVTSEAPHRLAERFPNYFDRVLVDAPCSGEGMFRKDNDVLKSWSINSPLEYSEIQKDVLNHGADMLAVGGRLLYSTCTFNRLENEDIINDFLRKRPNFSVIPMDNLEPYKSTIDGNIEGSVRLFPHNIKGEGHFFAYLQKNDIDSGALKTGSYDKNHKPLVLNKDQTLLFDKFSAETLARPLTDSLEVHGDYLLSLPDDFEDIRQRLKGLRVVASGRHVGVFKPKRFEPSQAFALSLKTEDCKNNITYDLDSEMITRYLKGESFECIGNDGWNLFCVQGYALGWAKVKDNRLKNKYLKSWLII